MWRLLKRPEMQRVENFKWKSGALGGSMQVPHVNQVIVGWTPNIGDTGNPLPVMGPADPEDAQTGEETLGGHVHFGLQHLNGQQTQALRGLTNSLLNLDIL